MTKTQPSKTAAGCCGCCAAEICCDAAAARAKTIASMSEQTGIEAEYCEKVYAWMDTQGIIFAPESLRPFVQDVVKMARAHKP